MESSAPALELANSSAQLNGWQPSQYTFLKDDIMKYMQQQTAEGALWDLVVLDPPKLAPNRKSLNRALVKYRKLNTMVGAAKQTPPLCTPLITLVIVTAQSFCILTLNDPPGGCLHAKPLQTPPTVSPSRRHHASSGHSPSLNPS